MDYLSDREFIVLHGEELFKMLVEPMEVVVNRKGFNAFATALVHGKILEELMSTFPDVPAAKSSLERRSFLVFKKNYLKKYGSPEWKRVYEVMKISFRWWLEYHQKSI